MLILLYHYILRKSIGKDTIYSICWRLDNGVCNNPERPDESQEQSPVRAYQTTTYLFRRGGTHRSTAFLFAQKRYQYDRRDLVTSSTDVRGTVTTNEYDILGRLQKTTVQLENSQQLVTEKEYDVLGNVISETTWRGTQALVTETVYDNFNRPIEVTDPAENSESYTYDTVGNKLSVTDKRGFVTNFTYDRANRQISVLMPALSDGSRPTTTTSYDKAGRITAVTDPNNKTTRNEYDAAGRKIKSINAANREIVYTYDSAGNILTQTVAGQTTAYTYDKRNLQLTETLNPDDSDFERITSYIYDNRGNRIRRTQPNGAITNYTC